MIQELISTSASRCLDGQAGFGVVAQTVGMSPNVRQAAVALSGYTHIAAPGSAKNPVIYLHVTRNTGGVLRHIVSRIADCGNDYSGRSNRIAHHWILEKEDIRSLPGGPAELTAQNIFRSHWQEKPIELATQKLSAADVSPKKCTAWEQLTGDAGWGGIVAERAEKGETISIVFSSEHNGESLRTLIGESLALLPSSARWKVTFSTYFMRSHEASGDKIQIKCFLAGSEESQFVRQSPNTLVIDLPQRLGAAPTGKYVELARGTVEPPPKAPSGTKIPAAKASAPTLSQVHKALQQVADKKSRVEETPMTDFPMMDYVESRNHAAAQEALAKRDAIRNTVIMSSLGGVILVLAVMVFMWDMSLRSVKSDYATLRRELASIRNVLDSDRGKNGQSEEKNDATHAETVNNIRHIQSAIQELKTRNAELQGQMDDLENEKMELKGVNQELQKTKKELEDKHEELEDRYTKLENEHKELQETKKELEDVKETNEDTVSINESGGSSERAQPATPLLDIEEKLQNLPTYWEKIAPPVEGKKVVLPGSEFLWDIRNRVNLRPNETMPRSILISNPTNAQITFRYSGTPAPLTFRRDELLAKIEITELGLQFEWMQTHKNDTQETILNSILQSLLHITVDRYVLHTINLQL